ncbi:hypothetical protein J6590_036996 [Homalodisca vitripennis]|nr:hypothetical protein J6590_036996 [Homalodisca vitripennis]
MLAEHGVTMSSVHAGLYDHVWLRCDTPAHALSMVWLCPVYMLVCTITCGYAATLRHTRHRADRLVNITGLRQPDTKCCIVAG